MKSISFVSFKGGAGRSVLLSNIAYQLAGKDGLNVGCLDADLESGGLHTVFNMRAPFDQFEPEDDQNKDSFPAQVYLMSEPHRDRCIRKTLNSADPVDIELPEFVHERFALDVARSTRSKILKDSLNNGNGRLYLIPASPNAEFTSQLDARGGNLYANFSTLISNFAEGSELDVMCVDCRAGISNLSFPALAYVDAVAICMRWGRQHREGTRRLIKWFTEWLNDFHKETKVFLVVSLSQHHDDEIEDHVYRYVEDNGFTEVVEEIFFVPYVDKLTESDEILLSAGDSEYSSVYLDIGQEMLNKMP